MNAHNEQQARKLLALGLDEFGHHTEAENVRKGIDLDDYKVDLWAIRAALDAQPAAAQEAGLTFASFRAANVSRCEKWHPAGIGSWSPSDWLTAAMGELGELASEVKMHNRVRDGLAGNKEELSPTERRRRMANEAADVVTYLDLFCAERGIDLGDALIRKFNEVSERVGFPERLPAAATEAPGIDEAIAAVDSIQKYMRDDFQALPPEVFLLPRRAQQTLVTLRGLADAPMRVHPRDAKEAVDYVVAHMLADSPKGGSDPWRGLYAPERAQNRDEYGCFYHPDIPSWDDEREESIAPLLKAQGFDLQCVPGDFSDEAMEEGGERYWQEMRDWNPVPEGDGWRLVAIYDTEDGPYSMFVKPLPQAGDAEVQRG